MRRVWLLVLALFAFAVGGAPRPASAAGTVGTSFPDDFPEIIDHSLGTPVIGFGSNEGTVTRTPVIFLHGNNDTPYPTTCNGSYGKIQAFAQHFADNGYSLKELWALGYQGDQCDLLTDQTRRAKEAHSTVANVPDLRAFVNAVLAYTGASQVDLVGHSLGATLSREWMRQDNAYAKVRRLVSIDGPHHGIINCSPDPANYYAAIGFVPDSPVCLEYGAADTPFLQALNAGDETPGPTEYLAIVNTDASFVYMSKQDGVLLPVPAQDRTGKPHVFDASARLAGAKTVELTGQGAHDQALMAAHTGIVNSPATWSATYDFLTRASEASEQAGPPSDPPVRPATSPATGPDLPATGSSPAPALVATVLVTLSLAMRNRR